MIKKIGAGYTVLIGLSMLGFWCMLLAGNRMPELATQPAYAAFHLAAEALTAASLILGGVGTLLRKRFGAKLYPVSLGMLLYSVLNAAGYFLQGADTAMGAMFIVFAVLTVLFILHYHCEKQTTELLVAKPNGLP